MSRWAGVARVIGLDVLAPLLVFQVSRSTGVPVTWALVLSGVPPLAGVVVDWWRWRTVEVVGLVVCASIALSAVLALLSADPRVVLLEGSVVTAALGVACLVSLRHRRPLIFFFAQAFYGGPRAAAGVELDEEYAAYEQARSFWRRVTVVWGVGYGLQASIQVVLALAASTQTSLVANRVLPWVCYGGLLAWSFRRGQRLRESQAATAPHGG